MPADGQPRGTAMFEALLLVTGASIGCAIGFAAAWALGGETREELAALKARAEEQERAAADKLALLAGARSELSAEFKAASAAALDSTSQTFLQLATASFQKHQVQAQSELEARQKAVDALVQPIKESLTKVDGKL